MAIKVRQGGAWVTVAEKNGVSATYTLPLTGATGSVGVGSARLTLDASVGTDTSVTLYPGNNINISSIDVTGDNRSFTITSTDTTYDYLLVDHGSSTGSGTGNDSILRLDPSTGTNDDIRIIAGPNISLTPNTSAGTLTIAASGGTQASPGGPDHAVQFNDNGSFNGTSQFTYDGSQYVTWTGTNSTIWWDSTQDAFEFNDGSEASFGTGKDLRIYHSSNNSYIDEWVGNDLYIRGKSSASTWNTTNKIYINAEANRASIIATANASVELYDATASSSFGKVLETNSRGIGVFNTNTNLGGELSIFDAVGAGNAGLYVSLKSPNALTASYTLTLPLDDGDANEVLKTDGNGNLDWTTNGSGATSPGGSDSQIQYNNGGAFGGANYFTYTDSGTSAGDVTFIGTNANVYWNYSADSFTINNSAYLTIGTDGSNNWSTRIYSDNSGGAIWSAQQGGGNIQIFGDDATTSHTITLKPNYSKDSIVATANAEVSLWYNGTKRIETTSDGIKITGGIQDKDGDLGTSGQVLSSTGTELNWIPAGGGSTSPGGTNKQVQFNDNGSFGGAANLEFTTSATAPSLVLSPSNTSTSTNGGHIKSSNSNASNYAQISYDGGIEIKRTNETITTGGPYIDFRYNATDMDARIQMDIAGGTTTDADFSAIRFLTGGGNLNGNVKERLRIGKAGEIGIDAEGSGRTAAQIYGTNGQVLKSGGSSASVYWANESGSGGSSTFLGLTDVYPTTYTGQAGKIVKVNSTPNGLEFGDETTYDLQGGGTDGGSGTFQSGVGKVILVPSTGTNDEVSITAGANIRIDGTSASGFTITADNSGGGGGTSYDYLLVDGGTGTGDGSGNNAILRLDPSTGDNDDITIVAGKNITLTQNSTDESLTFKSGVTIQSGGSNVTNPVATTLNFTGSGVSVTGNNEIKTINISGGSGGGTTYDLKGGGTDGSNYTTARGSGKIILVPSTGTDDEVTITAGQNIKIDGTGDTGFTISAASAGSGSGPTYTLPLTASSGSSGSATWTLTPSDSSTANSVKLNAGTNVSISSIDTTGPDYEFTIDVDTAGGLSLDSSVTDVLDLSGTGVLSADDAGADKIVFWDDSESKLTHLAVDGTTIEIDGTTLKAIGGGSGTTYELEGGGTDGSSFGTGTGTVNLKTGGSIQDTVTLTAGTNIKIDGTGDTGFTISADSGSDTNTTYTLPLAASTGANGSATWTLTPTSGTATSVKLIAGSNVSIGTVDLSGNDRSFTIDVASAGGLSLSTNLSEVFDLSTGGVLSADDAGSDGLVYWDESASKLTHFKVGTGNGGKVLKVNSTGNAIEWGTASGGGDGNTTYTLPLTGSSSAVVWTLTGTNPSSTDPVTMNAGSGIEFSSIATGAFTISASSTSGGATYALDGIVSSSNGSSGIKLTGTNLSSPDNVLIEGADGISVTGTASKLTISGSAVGGTKYDLTAGNGSNAYSEKILLTGTDSTEDAVTLAVDSTSSLSISRSGNTITFGGGGSGTDTKYDLDATSSTDGAKIRLVGTTASGNVNDEVELVGGTNVDVTRDSSTKITIDFDSANFALDKITEGNSKVEVVDTTSDSYVTFEIDGEEAARIDSGRQLLLKKTGTHEGGHIAFYDASTTDSSGNPIEGGSRSYGIDVYRNDGSSPYVLRFIDESGGVPGTERFSVGPNGQWGVGHITNRDFGGIGEVFTSNGPDAAPSWESAGGGSSSAAYFRVATNINSGDTLIGNGSNNSYVGILTAAISKDSGTDMLIQTQMNFRHYIYNGTSYTPGGVHVHFKIMRRIGTSGSWGQVGQELVLDNLFLANNVNTSSSGMYLNDSGGLSIPDASINTTTATPSAPIYYALYAKYVGYGRFNNSALATGAYLLKGSSIIVTEFGRR